MSEDGTSGTRVRIVCPGCETEARVPVSNVGDVISQHNDQIHDGDEVAVVDPDVKDALASLIADNLGLSGAE